MKKRILFLAILFISLIVMPVFAEEPEIGTENPITPEITEKLDINDEQVVISAVEDETYTGSAIEPKVTILYNETELIENTDYTLEYKDNINSGTATIKIVGQGNYTGTKELSFQINSRNVTTLKYSNINNYIYSGKAITPKPTITHNGVRMVNGKDYTLEYKNNTNVGIATVTVVGKGNYTGRKQITFKILKRSITTASISSIGTKIYTGSLIKPSLRIKYNNISLAKGKSYKVTYKNNKNIGVATVTITGIGNYKGTKKITFRIIPRKTTISSALLNGKME